MVERQRGLRAPGAGQQDLPATRGIHLHGHRLAVIGDKGHRPAGRDRGRRRQRDGEAGDRRVVIR